MKHLIKFYVGPTSGPRSWSSKLGKEISNLKNNLKNIVDFEPIKGRVIAVDEELLTNGDQKYAYYLALGIQKGPEFLREIMGECPDLPCSMSLARWLNTQSYIMRKYVQTEKPTKALKRLVAITLNWYLPLFFEIKKDCHVKYGALHFFQAIKYAQESFTEPEKKKAWKYFRINAYNAHPESVLLSGICHPFRSTRMKCAEIIIKARRRARRSDEVRPFKVPELNFEAESFLEMVDLSKADVTPPPLLKNYSDNELELAALDGSIELPEIYCHSIHNERAVKDTTTASKREIGQKKSHEHILNLISNRENIPLRHTKSDFKS